MDQAGDKNGVGPNDLPVIISNAWQRTLTTVRNKPSLMGNSSTKRNIGRARVWVDALGSEFAARYVSPDFHVFWISNNRKNPVCGSLKELLFDIAVCKLDSTRSLEANPRTLKFVSNAQWLVESEFNKGNTREIILDMSKLAIGTAPFKLFVAAHRRDSSEQQLLDRLRPLASYCGAGLFIAFVSHPKEWFGKLQREPVIHKWLDKANDWRLFSD